MRNKHSPEKLSIMIYDHNFDKVHYALVIASAAAAIGRPTTLFFTMGACQVLLDTNEKGKHAWSEMPLSDENGLGKERDAFYRRSGVATFEELIEACNAFNVRFLVCEMGLRVKGLEHHVLRKDIKIERGGIVTFLNDASKNGAMLII